MPLITIEGLDGSGKSTIAEMLTKYLTDRGEKCTYLHFPSGKGRYGRFIKSYLNGEYGGLKRVNPYFSALLFAMDRLQFAEYLEELKRGEDWVILDRYVCSNIAYQCARVRRKNDRNALYDTIHLLEYDIDEIPFPTVGLFLDVPLKFVKHNLQMRKRRDMHELSMKYQRDVRKEYLRLSERGYLERIDCTDGKGGVYPPEVILSKVLGYLPVK